jgi:predicted signal transduction protein with EAL and GGDEF domain
MGDGDRVLPLEAIEIDRCFVADLRVRPKCRTVLLPIVARPNALCWRTNSERAQTAEQVPALSKQECAPMSGFRFSRRLLAVEFRDLAGTFGGASTRAGAGRFDRPERAGVRRRL